MKRKGRTSQRTILFRQNVNRDNEEWAHFLEGYREWLMEWDMMEYGDDWHTAEDVVSEIFLGIIMEPLITNLRPNDSFRHTLIVLCKHEHRDVTKPWRRGLAEKLCAALRLTLRSRSDALVDATLGLVDLVEADLMDRTRDGMRAFKTFSKEDLKRWRTLREAEAKEEPKELRRGQSPIDEFEIGLVPLAVICFHAPVLPHEPGELLGRVGVGIVRGQVIGDDLRQPAKRGQSTLGKDIMASRTPRAAGTSR